jgi:hypothetical protein
LPIPGPAGSYSTGPDGAMQYLGQNYPMLMRMLGQEGMAALQRGELSGLAILLPGMALAFTRGSVVLEEMGLPNSIRIADKHVGISIGGRFGAGFSNAEALLGVDARGKVGNTEVIGRVSAFTGADGPTQLDASALVRNSKVIIDLRGRVAKEGVWAVANVEAGKASGDAQVRLGPGGTFDHFEAGGSYKAGVVTLSGRVLASAMFGAGGSFNATVPVPKGTLSVGVRVGAATRPAIVTPTSPLLSAPPPPAPGLGQPVTIVPSSPALTVAYSTEAAKDVNLTLSAGVNANGLDSARVGLSKYGDGHEWSGGFSYTPELGPAADVYFRVGRIRVDARGSKQGGILGLSGSF